MNTKPPRRPLIFGIRHTPTGHWMYAASCADHDWWSLSTWTTAIYAMDLHMEEHTHPAEPRPGATTRPARVHKQPGIREYIQ